jgi:hypothetical protein
VDSPADLFIAEVDCVDNESTCAKAGVSGYPTLKLYHSGAVVDYAGGRTADELLSWAEKMMGPTVEPIDAPSFAALNAEVVFVLAHPDHASMAAFEAGAAPFKAQLPFYALDAQASAGFAPTEAGAAVFAIKDGEAIVLPGELTPEAISAFIATHKFPYLPELGPSNFRELATVPSRRLVISVVDSGADATDAFKAAHRAFSKTDGSAKFTHAWIDGVRWEYFASAYDISEFPSTLVLDVPHRVFWTSRSVPETADNLALSEFLAGVLDGSIEGQPIGGAPPAAAPSKLKELAVVFEMLLRDRPVVIVVAAAVFVALVIASCSLCFRGAPAQLKEAEEAEEELVEDEEAPKTEDAPADTAAVAEETAAE